MPVVRCGVREETLRLVELGCSTPYSTSAEGRTSLGCSAALPTCSSVTESRTLCPVHRWRCETALSLRSDPQRPTEARTHSHQRPIVHAPAVLSVLSVLAVLAVLATGRRREHRARPAADESIHGVHPQTVTPVSCAVHQPTSAVHSHTVTRTHNTAITHHSATPHRTVCPITSRHIANGHHTHAHTSLHINYPAPLTAMFASLPPSIDVPLVHGLQQRLLQYQQIQHTQPPHHSAPLINDILASTQQALSLHRSLSLLAAQHAKQARLLDRLQADNQRLRRENDACIDQLFLHSISVDGALHTSQHATERRKTEKGSRQRTMVTNMKTYLSGFESTDEEEEDGDGQEEEGESGDDISSQRTVSSSESPSRSDGHRESGVEPGPPTAVVIPTSTAAPLFDSLVQSLATHPSKQHINTHLAHLSTLLTLQASQPLSIPPTSPPALPSSANGFDRTDGSGSFGRSTELDAVMEMRVQLQRERTRRSRRLVGQLRQLLLHRSAEVAALRSELEVLRVAVHDSYSSSAARDTLQLHEWMAAMEERSVSRAGGGRAAAAVNGQAGETRRSVGVSSVSDVQQMCGLLDGVMRHVQDSAVRSQAYVEDVKRLCTQRSQQQSCAVASTS